MKLKKRRHKKELSAAIVRSQRFLAEGRHEENLEYLEEGVAKRFPNDPEIRLLYGTALLEVRPRVGLSEIAKAIELDPDDPVRLTRAARIMYSMKQFDRARSYAKRAKDLAPENFVFGPELLNLESNFAALDGKDDLAEEGLRLAVEREPEMEVLAWDLAKFLVDRAREEEALSVIDEALKRTKTNKYLKRLRAEILDGDKE
jgi:tetratricopeptide (TPR) repeat protein